MKCHCGTEIDFDQCCNLYLTGEDLAPTAEALMRSRYSAYVTGNIEYIELTHDPKTRHELDRSELSKWSKSSKWHGLEVLKKEAGNEQDRRGFVEFRAHYEIGDHEYAHHENAEFYKEDGEWFYLDGEAMGKDPFVREDPKVGRNDPCTCGSGKKFKKCCGQN